MTASALDPALHVEQEDEEEKKQSEFLYVSVVKFLHGEEVLCSIRGDDMNWTVKKFITVYDPVVVDPGLKFRPWSELTDQTQIEIQTCDIRAIYGVKERIEEAYDDWCGEQYYAGLREDLKDPDLTDEARDEIEAILLNAYDGSEELKEEEEDVLTSWMMPSKTLH